MARSLGFATYRALSWRARPPVSGSGAERPAGEVLWAHATSGERLAALDDLAVRLTAQRPGLKVLLTQNRDRSDTPALSGSDRVLHLGSDHPVAVRQFLDHWRPDIGIWAGGDLMPNLIVQAAQRRLPMVLVDIARDEVPARRHRWLPDAAHETLGCFDAILARDEATAALIRKAGVVPSRVIATAMLRPGAMPPACRDRDLTAAARDLAGRSIWLAAAAQAREFETILAAQRAARRLVHRLLAVINPADPGDLGALKAQLAAAGMRFADWDLGDRVGEETQVIVASGPEGLGLWYRIAPLTLVASTLVRGPGGRNPMEPAALGSAVLHGPSTGAFPDAFDRLAAAGAVELVRNADQLGAAVVRLVAPDRAAALALAGWEVATEGAPVTDRLIDLVQDMLDLRERSGAAP